MEISSLELFPLSPNSVGIVIFPELSEPSTCLNDCHHLTDCGLCGRASLGTVSTCAPKFLGNSIRCRFSEYIGVREGRAVMWALRRLAKQFLNLRWRHCGLLHIFAVCCAVTQGRHDYCILQLCRVMAALSFATEIILCFRWVPSERNPAGASSRVFDDSWACK